MRKWQRDRIKRGEDPSAGWIRETHIVVNGRHVEPGTEFSVRGERGRFRFVEQVTTPEGAVWVSAIGGTKHVTMYRAFRPERIRRVHRVQTRMTTAEARELAREKRQARAADAQRKARLAARAKSK